MVAVVNELLILELLFKGLFIMAKTEKKWYETPYTYPPINSIVLAEYNTIKYEYFKAKILSHDTDGNGVLLMWLEGPSVSITQKKYNASYFKPIMPTENKEKDSPKQEKSLDNLLKELHNLKQEEKELSAKVDNILKEINSVVGLYGLSILFTNEYDMLQENN